MDGVRNVSIDFSIGNRIYHVIVDSKITVIKGQSGSGKSYFVDQLANSLSEHSNDDSSVHTDTSLSVSNNYRIVILPITFGFIPDNYSDRVRSISNTERRDLDRLLAARVLYALQELAGSKSVGDLANVIFISDEKSKYVDSRFFQKAVNEVPSLFIFVNRDPMFSIPYGVHNVMVFNTFDNVTDNVSYFENINRFDRSDYSRVFCEDSKSGLEFFKQIVDFSENLDTIGSKDNILELWDQYTNSLFILDSLGCGATLDRLHNYILAQKIHNQNDVYLIGSFEHMLLTSEFAKRGNAKSGFVLREPAINEWNVEEFYAKELSRFCVEALKMRMGYHKKDLASCFVEACKSSVKDCNGLLDFTQSSCDYRIPGTLQDKFKTLVPADLYQVLINLRGDSKLTCNQSQDNAKLSEQPDTDSGKTNSKDSESDITTNLFG